MLRPDDEIRLCVAELLMLLHHAFAEGSKYQPEPGQPNLVTDLEGRRVWAMGKFAELQPRLEEIATGEVRPPRQLHS